MNKNKIDLIRENFVKICKVETRRNFINETVGGSYVNNSSMVVLNEMTVDRLLGKHYQTGFAIVSACRGDWSDNEMENRQINNQKTAELGNDIRQRGFSFVPVFGGFIENMGSENEQHVYESSFIILNYDTKGNELDFNDLKNFAVEMCDKFNQDSVLVKAPNGKPQYITRNNEVDMEFDGDVKINDLTQQYFTSFVKTQNLASNQSDRKQSRFTFESCYVNPVPQSLNERISRSKKGEIFLEK